MRGKERDTPRPPLRWPLRALAALCIVTGTVLLPPFVFFLVYVTFDPLWMFPNFRLEFWETELIALVLLIFGIWLMRRSFRPARTRRIR